MNSLDGVNLDLATLHQAARELLDSQLKEYHFSPTAGSTDAHGATHTYRGGDRFLVFGLEGGEPPYGRVLIGIGAEDAHITESNSMTLEDLMAIYYAGSGRGSYRLDEMTVHEFLQRALHDLVEFAHDFLYGDIRQFIRLIATRNRERSNGRRPQASLY